MEQIRVQPDRLEELSSQLRQRANEMREQDMRLDRALDSLTWQVRARADVEADMQQARQRVAELSQSAEAWGQFLLGKARAFLQADLESGQRFAAITSGGPGHAVQDGTGVAPGHGPQGDLGAPNPGVVAGPGGSLGAVSGGSGYAGDSPASDPAAEAPANPGEEPRLADGGAELLSVPRGAGVPATDPRRWVPVDTDVTSSPETRAEMTAEQRRQQYDKVLAQFNVEHNPRYLPGENTYCNIFVTDATRAMGAEIPHWVNADGSPAAPGTRGAHELDANATVNWLEQHGDAYGWRQVSPSEAQQMANDGRPAVAVMEKPGAIGHVAVVRPGQYNPNQGCALANVGAHNLSRDTTRGGFGTTKVEYWVHA